MLSLAVAAIGNGKIVGLPTDTVYGLAVDAFDGAAVAGLYQLKGRPVSKPISLLVDTLDRAAELAVLPPSASELVAKHWPGPLTVVVRTRVSLPDWVGDSAASTVGLRIPAHKTALALLRQTGPLAVTSANLSSQATAVDNVAAEAIFGAAVAVYLEGTGGGVASTVIDCTGSEPQILRAGPLAL